MRPMSFFVFNILSHITLKLAGQLFGVMVVFGVSLIEKTWVEA